METVTTEKKFFEKNELEKLNEIQEKTKQLVFELGEIEMFKIQLEQRRKQAEDFLETTTIEEKTLTSSLSEKYGHVNINPKTGEITKLD